MWKKYSLFGVSLLILATSGKADPGVLVEAENDTVTKFIYTGSSPNSTTHPAVSVGGKALGLGVVASNVSYARAVVGQVTGGSLPGSPNRIGVLGVAGSSGTGVYGKGTSNGVYGDGYVGVHGVGAYGVWGNGGDWAGYFDGNVYSSGVYDGSDRILKENIRPLEKGLGTVLALEPKAYEMKKVAGGRGGETRYGLIAQDLQEVVPEVVRDVKAPPQEGKSDSERLEFKAVNYSALIPILINAIKEQQEQIEALRLEVQAK